MEFFPGYPATEFQRDFFSELEIINPQIETVEELWMNDETLLHITSSKGEFFISKSIWGFAFIMAKENQSCILFIDSILSKSNLFEREEVDFETYKS